MMLRYERWRPRAACCLLVVSCAAAILSSAACNRPSSSASSVSQGASAPAAAERDRPIAGLLPDGDAPGWTREGTPEIYRAGNLWEYIDGAAETYLAFGFEELATARYRDAASKATATVDVYRMGKPLEAFGIYAQELNPGAGAFDAGAAGYQAANTINFWSGPYYVKVTGSAETPAGEPLQKLARAIAARLGRPGPPPPELDWFPRERLVAGSVKLVPHDALGQRFLEGALEAQYRDGVATWKLLAIRLPHADGARGAYGRYREFLASSGAVTPVAGVGDEAFAGQDRFYGPVVAARAGSMLVIALGKAPLETMTSTMKTLARRLRQSG
jgi:hypothetical protein